MDAPDGTAIVAGGTSSSTATSTAAPPRRCRSIPTRSGRRPPQRRRRPARHDLRRRSRRSSSRRPDRADRIFGNADADTFTFDSTLLGAEDPRVRQRDPAADERRRRAGLRASSAPDGGRRRHTLTLDGQQRRRYLRGVARPGARATGAYVVNVLDTGHVRHRHAHRATAPRRATTCSCSDASTAIVGEDVDAAARSSRSSTTTSPTPATPRPVGLGALTAAGGAAGQLRRRPRRRRRRPVRPRPRRQRHVRDRRQRARPTRLDGGDGADTFQIGQLYGRKRTVARKPRGERRASRRRATTRGWLSNGISRPLIASGGDGNDVFVVYANKAPLTLLGDARQRPLHGPRLRARGDDRRLHRRHTRAARSCGATRRPGSRCRS